MNDEQYKEALSRITQQIEESKKLVEGITESNRLMQIAVTETSKRNDLLEEESK